MYSDYNPLFFAQHEFGKTIFHYMKRPKTSKGWEGGVGLKIFLWKGRVFDISFEKYISVHKILVKIVFFNYSHPYVQGVTQFKNNETLKSRSISTSYAYPTLEECVIFQTYLNRTLQGIMGMGNYFEVLKSRTIAKSLKPRPISSCTSYIIGLSNTYILCCMVGHISYVLKMAEEKRNIGCFSPLRDLQ